MDKLREPLRTLVGKYESQLLRRRLHRRTSADVASSLWRFFRSFPKKSAPEQFAGADVADYRVWRAEQGGAYSTIRKELCHVHMFFSWLIEEVPEYREFPQPVV